MPKHVLILPERFWRKLKNLYKKLHIRHPSSGEKEYEEEKEDLQRIVGEINEKISYRYKILTPLGVGGVSIVIMVEDNYLGQTPRALKFPRPKKGREELFGEILSSEIKSLREAVHPSIIEIYEEGSIGFRSFSFYIMEYLDEPRPAIEYFEAGDKDESEVIDFLRQTLAGLAHLHSLKIMHGDIKLENILVSKDGRAVIADLGSARNLSKKRPTETFAIFTRPYGHPRLEALAANTSSQISDLNRVRAEKIKRSDLDLIFDLYALGKNIFRLLGFYDGKRRKKIKPYTRKYLSLMAARLLDGYNSEDEGECALGLPQVAFADEEIKYNEIKQVKEDLEKLTGEYPVHQIIPEIDEHSVRTIQTSSLSPTPFTERLSKTIKHPLIRRLEGISQLGFINLVYPTATHSRFEHVLGTFSNVRCYCDALYHDPVNPFFKQIINEKDIKSLFLAALLHDIGQYPLAHDFEEAEPKEFSHRKLGIELLGGENETLMVSKLRQLISEDWGVDLKAVIGIIDAGPLDVDIPIKYRLLHTIIDGPIDADKLDYLVRDASNLNVPFGKAIDFERLLQCLTIVFDEFAEGVYIALGIHEKGKVPAESLAFARYAMFGTVYWHHTTRAAKSMLHRAIWESPSLLEDEESKEKYRKSFWEFWVGKKIESLQGDLFPETEEDLRLPDSTQLLPSDKAIIEWLYGKTTKVGKALLAMLEKRELYKRLLVISKQRDSKLWRMLRDFRNNYHWEKMVDLQKEIQRRIIVHIERAVKNRLINPEDEELAKLRELGDKNRAIILLDVPKDRPGSSIPLEYLPEEERREMLGEWRGPSELEDSVVWTQLHDSFVESVGKARLFCHPGKGIREIIERAISRKILRNIVQASIVKLQ